MDRIEVYRDVRGEWRWRRWSEGNNRVIADSGEGYLNQEFCIEQAVRSTHEATLEVSDE